MASGCALGSRNQVEKAPYLDRRDSFATTLLFSEPAPQTWEVETPPPSVEEVFYGSGDLSLKAWVYIPEDQPGQKPALIYYHGGFAFSASEMKVCQPFMDAGYVVMFPMLRGENGNPGDFELFWGEVDDANAAAKWLADQPYVDRSRIYAFGHSIGGGISALLSLMDEVPILHSGSSGGLYTSRVFESWNSYGYVPFDIEIDQEIELRLLLGNTQHMQRSHYAYIGRQDSFAQVKKLVQKEGGEESLLSVIPVDGDHFSSLDAAVLQYLERTENPE